MIKVHGVSVNFGIGSEIIDVQGLFQSRDHNYKIENASIKDGGDTTISKVYFDPAEYATFVYVAIGERVLDAETEAIDGISSEADVTIPELGKWITITDNQKYPKIAGEWLVENISVASSNTSATRVTLSIARYPEVENI